MLNSTALQQAYAVEKRSMKYFAGLDVSVKETSICIVDEAGKICSECKAPSFPEDLVGALNNPNGDLNALAWKRARCRNGCSVAWLGRDCQRSVLKRATRRLSCKRR